jgi:hypothetical protein
MPTRFLAAALVFVSTSVLASPLIEMKGLKPAEGCLEPTKAVTERLKTCPVESTKIRIWCPNGKVFDRDEATSTPIAVLRSICEMNQLSG